MQRRRGAARAWLGVGAACLGLAAVTTARADTGSEVPHAATTTANESHPVDDAADHAAEHVAHHHHLGVFLGGGVRDEHGEVASGFALGFEYEYRVHPLIGVGGLVEVATGDLRDVVVMAPVVVHPWRGLKLVAAPGAEFRRDEDAEFLIRLGVGYLVPFRRVTVGPEFNVDVVDGHPTVIVGISVGFGL